MSEKQGFVLLWRKIQDNPLWLKETFTRGQAWVDLVMLANHQDGYIRVRGNRLEVKRGEVGYSKQTLSKRWKWSLGKITRFLDELENDGQITQKWKGKTEHRISSITTINNYETYQQRNTRRNTDGTQTEHRQVANNNGNNDKECKRIRENKFSPPSLSEIEEYITSMQYGLDAQDFLDKNTAAGWVMNGGKKVKDWKAHLRSWETRRKKWEKPKDAFVAFEEMLSKYLNCNSPQKKWFYNGLSLTKAKVEINSFYPDETERISNDTRFLVENYNQVENYLKNYEDTTNS